MRATKTVDEHDCVLRIFGAVNPDSGVAPAHLEQSNLNGNLGKPRLQWVQSTHRGRVYSNRS